MNLKEVVLYRKNINQAARAVGLAIFFTVLSPMVLVILWAIRTTENKIQVNLYGIGFMVLCGVIGFIVGMIGAYGLITLKKKNLNVSKRGMEYATEWKEKVLHGWLWAAILSVSSCIMSILPVIAVSILSPYNRKFIALSYVSVFLLTGGGISLIVTVLTRRYVVKKIEFSPSREEISDLSIEKDRIHKTAIIKTISYWILVLVVALVIEWYLKEWGSSSNFLLISSASFVLWYVLTNPLGEWDNVKSRSRIRTIFTVVVVFLMMGVIFVAMSQGNWYIQPYISTIPRVEHHRLNIEHEKEEGVYSIVMEEGRDVKILQLTDIHLGGSLFSYRKDLRALEAVYTLIERTKPDLVIVTGDVAYPFGIQSFSLNNYNPMMQFAAFMRNIGIPWAFTYGNHDTEKIASHTKEEINDLLEDFSYERTNTLLYPLVQPDITGRSNQVILIRNPDFSINQAIYLLDSNSYASGKLGDYDYIHDDQVDWYKNSVTKLSEEEGKVISSLIFTHIPLQEYKTAYELYRKGSKDVTYYYGENQEKVCSSNHKSKLFDTMVELGSTKGIFVGHDHYNNSSLEYRNIRLTYGMSIDYLAMPGIANRTRQRGATLITLYSDSSFDSKLIPLLITIRE